MSGYLPSKTLGRAYKKLEQFNFVDFSEKLWHWTCRNFNNHANVLHNLHNCSSNSPTCSTTTSTCSTTAQLCQLIPKPHQCNCKWSKINLKNRNVFGSAVGIHDFWYQWAGTKHSGELTKSWKAWISFQLGEVAQHFVALVEVVGEVVEVTAGPMSQLFWKVNEVKMFRHNFLWALPSVLDDKYPLSGTKSRGFQLRSRKCSCF